MAWKLGTPVLEHLLYAVQSKQKQHGGRTIQIPQQNFMCLIVGVWRESFSSDIHRPLSTVTRRSPLKHTAPRKIMGSDSTHDKHHTESITHTCTHGISSTLYLAFIYSTRPPYEIGNPAPSYRRGLRTGEQVGGKTGI